MESKVLKNIAVFVFLFGVSRVCFAQSALVSCGVTHSETQGNISYSSGQVAFSFSKKQQSVSQGVQQSYGYLKLRKKIEMKGYPNPCTSQITVNIKLLNEQQFQFVLMDTDGNQLKRGNIKGSFVHLKMDAFAAGNYVLNVETKSGRKGSFLFIKSE